MNVADIILSQIGGRAIYMINAKDFVDIGDGVVFSIMPNNKKVTHVEIKLNACDLYDINFYNIRSGNKKLISREDDIFFDCLRDAIERNTELYLSI